tara:strand:+ start:1485 stop:1619 length:135 start_codon:yes stop_codon:yes gene_type:complete
MTKIMTTNKLKGNPWNGTDMNKDRRTHNTKVNKSKGTKRAKRSS